MKVFDARRAAITPANGNYVTCGDIQRAADMVGAEVVVYSDDMVYLPPSLVEGDEGAFYRSNGRWYTDSWSGKRTVLAQDGTLHRMLESILAGEEPRKPY